MKIIYKGVNPDEVPFHLECEKCKTVLEVIIKDLTFSSDQRDSGYYINCPICEYMIWDTPTTRSKGAIKAAEKVEKEVNEKKSSVISGCSYRDI